MPPPPPNPPPSGPPPAYDFKPPAHENVKVVVGNTARTNSADSSKFDWDLFVRFGSNAHLVDRVDVELHHTFREQHRTLVGPSDDGTWTLPTVTGWGVFVLTVTVEWKPAPNRNKRSKIQHMLQFSSDEVLTTTTVSLTKPAPPSGSWRRQPRLPPGVRGSTRLSTPQIPQLDTSKPADEKHTVIAMVVDRSGSMRSMGAEVEGGCNAYLDEQRSADAEDEARTTVLLTTFDSTVEQVLDGVPLSTLPPITHEQVEPRGCTALYDGIGSTLVRTVELVNELSAMPSVTIFILTDGAENASRTWTKALVTKEIKRLQDDYGWDVYFAAANQDALKEGASMGMDVGKCMTYAAEGVKMKAAFRSANQAYQRKKKGLDDGCYTALERQECL